MKYRLVIFDCDGTLADTLPWMRGIFNELADEYGFKRVAPEQHERYRDLEGLELLKALDLPLWKVPQVVNHMRTLMAQRIELFSLFDGIQGALRGLSAGGIRLAIVSSNSRANVERVLGPNNANLISHYACEASLFGKAAKLSRVARASSIRPGQTIYIGDEIRDAEAAKKAGMSFGAVAWGQHSAEALQARHPAEFFRTVPEMTEKLCCQRRA